MNRTSKIGLSLALVLVWAGDTMAAEPPHEHAAARPAAQPEVRRGEPHPGPGGYQRPSEPKGWNARPSTVDRGAYKHNYQAARSFKVGPYRRPPGWTAHRWTFGEILPPAFWASQYILADYWLFALEVPPVGYEWVRYGNDALLVSTDGGEILQVEYGVFS